MKVAVVGSGHVGVVTCVALASMGHEAVGIEASYTGPDPGRERGRAHVERDRHAGAR